MCADAIVDDLKQFRSDSTQQFWVKLDLNGRAVERYRFPNVITANARSRVPCSHAAELKAQYT